jgi:flagellar L-ring protein FlgH
MRSSNLHMFKSENIELVVAASVLALLFAFPMVATGQSPSPQQQGAQTAQSGAPIPDMKGGPTYAELYERYLASARTTQAGPNASINWMVGLGDDPRAHRVNDLVTIRVLESISASGKADSSVAKNSGANANATNLFGAEHYFPGALDPTRIVGLGYDSKFTGAGATTRESELTAVLTARVVEVLPNGDLVLEGARELDVNGDRQIVVLTGVVRQADILPNNVVPSTMIGQLSIRYFGNGLIKDSLKPGILVRMLNKIF